MRITSLGLFGKASALSHEANLEKLCIMCGMERPKGKGTRVPTKLVADSIRENFKPDFDPESLLMPRGLCSKHRKHLDKVKSKTKSPDELPEPYDFSQLAIPTQTRGNRDSLCQFISLCLFQARSNQ